MKRKPPRFHAGPLSHPLLPRAVELHQSGHLGDAAEIYQQIITQQPHNFDANHLLGVVALQQGHLAEAKRLISAALVLNPKDAPAMGNLGTAYLRDGQLESALKSFESALKVQPRSISSLTNLGTVLRRLDRSREALAPLRQAYQADPKSAAVCNLLGACLLDTGDLSGAVKIFEAATRAHPEDPDGWANLAVALTGTGDISRAMECAAKSVAMKPNSSSGLAALAAVQFESGQIETSIDTYREAVETAEPTTQLLCAFAQALMASGLNAEAIDDLERAIVADGNNAIARWRLAVAHCYPIYQNLAELADSRKAFAASLEVLGAWFEAKRPSEAFTAVGSSQPFFLAYQSFNNKELLGRYGHLCCEWMASMPANSIVSQKRTAPQPGQSGGTVNKTRVGFVSAHIRDHSVWNAITKGWIEHLDRDRFEIHLFQLSRVSDAETKAARSVADYFEDSAKGLSAWIQTITRANLDALIYPEIGMDAVTTQLASLRLAPVQATAWGHPETSGLPTIDLYLSAKTFEPPEAEKNYCEKLVQLPNLGVYVEPLGPEPAVFDLGSVGLPDNEPLLLCAGTPFKYSPANDIVWARIAKGLHSKRGGRLVFFRSRIQAMDQQFEHRLRAAFDRERVKFDARVCWVPNLRRPQFFGLMQRSALMLDTIGFSGFNTALQSIECGLPVLARESDFMRGRLASGIMRRIGMHELVATSDEGFIESAIRLAGDAPQRALHREQIVQRRDAIFRDLEPVRALEKCLIDEIARRSS